MDISSRNATVNPIISVIIPCRNAERYLGACLASMRHQPEIGEIIVVGDASTDSTTAVAQFHAKTDSRVQVIELPERQATSVARTQGLLLPRSPGSDSLMPMTYCQKMLHILWHP